MTACVFLGPTLPVADARKVLDAEYLPPVRQGDVYRAVRHSRPSVIGIIDGYFHQVPSVWHKEILWAMAEGVHVLGSSSMGALRAAELEQFGMRGVGEVFAAYRDREIEDDDEVAVIHGPPETNFIAASEAMVNIRRTLKNAQAEEVISAETEQVLNEIAKSLFYPRRSYPELIERGAAEGLSTGELSALRHWLTQGRVDLKRRDALELLEEMGKLLAGEAEKKTVEYRFEHTTMWEAAVREIDAVDSESSSDSLPGMNQALLEELRLDPDAYRELKQAALLRLLGRREAERSRIHIDDDALRQQITDFRLQHGLHFGRELDAWLAQRDLDRQTFSQIMKDELLADRLADEMKTELDQFVIGELRARGDYARIASRARAKQIALDGEPARNEQVDFDAARALTWYFTQRLGRPVPENLDNWAARAGFDNAQAFGQAVAREYRYRLAGLKE